MSGFPYRGPASRSHDSYSVGVICALATEKAAVEAMLDAKHPKLHKVAGDDNIYTLGKIGAHNVAIACLPAGVTGKVSATAVAKDMMRSFPIKIGLMVGVGGGVWSKTVDMRLGDVVISQPDGMHGGVLQWDFGKMEKGGSFRRTGTLDKPPRVLLNAIQELKVKHMMQGSTLSRHLSKMALEMPYMANEFGHQGAENDQLFEADYYHAKGETCTECDTGKLVNRGSSRPDNSPRIFYGNIASGDEVMEDGVTRDRIAKEEGVICFEMEAAGLMENFPCVAIRGICDYADSHKNERWQPYAAATAAACAKELLEHIDEQGVDDLRPANARQFNIPFSLEGVPSIQKFVGREEEKRQLALHLLPTTMGQARRRVFVVQGLGGIGKTQLAIEYARKYRDSYSAVLWLDGSSKDRLKQSLARVAERIPPDQIAAQATAATPSNIPDVDALVSGALDWLSLPGNRHWLIVIDNVDREYRGNGVDEEAYDLKSMFPVADQGSILVTSRLSSIAQNGDSLRLGGVSEAESKAILEHNAGSALQDTNLITTRLNGLPLSLTQAGSFIRRTGLSASSYAKYYDVTWHKLMEKQDRFPLQEYAWRSILTTWTVSYEQVARQSGDAAMLLKLWAYLDCNDLWHGLIASASLLDASVIKPEWLIRLAGSELEFLDALGVLSEFSLVDSKMETASYSMHSVLHKWCLGLSADCDEKSLGLLGLGMVGRMVPSDTEQEYWKMERRLLPHGKQLYETVIMDGVGKIVELPPWEMHQLGLLFARQNAFIQAKGIYLRALAGYEKAWGPDHTSTLGTVSNLGSLYRDQGRMKDAEEMCLRALAGFEKAWGPDHTSTLDTVHNLGVLYSDQGRMKDAEEMYLRALAGREKAWGPDHTSTLDTVNNLGILYRDQGRMKDAEEMCLRALAGREKAWGPDHTSTLSTVNNLGILYRNQGRMKDAEEMCLRALAGFEKAWGADHRRVYDARYNLAVFYESLLRINEARHQYFITASGYSKLLGSNHEETKDAWTRHERCVKSSRVQAEEN